MLTYYDYGDILSVPLILKSLTTSLILKKQLNINKDWVNVLSMTTIIDNYGLDSPARTLLLLVLSIKDGNKKTEMDKLHIQKVIRFFEHLRQKKEIDFSNYKLGGVSYELEENIESLLEYGLIDQKNNDFILTNEGERATKALRQSIARDEYEKLAIAKRRLNDLPHDELLYFMYMTIPETQKHSTELQRLDKKKETLVVSLFSKGKIDASSASKWLGMSEKDFFKSNSITRLLAEGYQESAKEDLAIANDFKQVENELDEECFT